MGKKKKKPFVQFSYLCEMTLDEGLRFISKKNLAKPLMVMGLKVKLESQRFEVMRTSKLQCFCCGKQATHWIISRHRNDRGWPFTLKLYSNNVMLTWDHIVPQSLGGGDHSDNARIACDKCNFNRGNSMSMSDLLWTLKQSPSRLYSPEKYTEPKQILGSLGNFIKRAKDDVPVYIEAASE